MFFIYFLNFIYIYIYMKQELQNIKEFFSIGGDTEVNISAKEKSRFDTNTNITNEQVNEFMNEFVSDVVNDLKISSSNISNLSAIASNVIKLHDIKCDNINLSNITQSNDVIVNAQTTITNEAETIIDNAIEQSVKRRIEKNVPKNMINDVLDRNNQAMATFLKDAGIDMNQLKNLAAATTAAASSSGIGNDVEVNISREKDTAMRNILGISNEQINKSVSKTSNSMITEIKKSLDNVTNTVVDAENKIELSKFTCGQLSMDQILQKNRLDIKVKNELRNKDNTSIKQSFKTNIDETFKSLYKDMKTDYAKGPPQGVNGDKWDKLMGARLSNLEAIEAGLYMAIIKPYEDRLQTQENEDAEFEGREPKNMRPITTKLQENVNNLLGKEDYQLKTEEEMEKESDEIDETDETDETDEIDEIDETEETNETEETDDVDETKKTNKMIKLLDQLFEPPYLYITLGIAIIVILIIIKIIIGLF